MINLSPRRFNSSATIGAYTLFVGSIDALGSSASAALEPSAATARPTPEPRGAKEAMSIIAVEGIEPDNKFHHLI